MAHFLEACVVFNKLIFPVHDRMFALNIHKDERDLLFTVENIDTFSILNDLHEVFHNSHLRKVVRSFQLVSKIYQLMKNTSNLITSTETPTADKFLNSLYFDEKGYLSKVKLNGSSHTLMLNQNSRLTRNKN